MNEEGEERYSLLPVDKCDIHPLAKIRFDYQVDELAESITALGQIQPGKAVQETNEEGMSARYLVYIGCRRLLACRKAGVKQFKALVVKTADENKILTELLTENMKRANLSVLEELNLLANYSRHQRSLEDLARDIGLSPKLMRARVKLAVLLQEKGLIETFYKVELVSGYRFTHRHIEKITELEEAKWLPVAVQAAELNWKAEDIEALGSKFTRESLIQTLPAWGRQFITGENDQAKAGPGAISSTSSSRNASDGSHRVSPPSMGHEGGDATNPSAFESHSRYQTMAESAQFLICPRCGSETPIEFPSFPPATLLKPSEVDKSANTVSLDKESIPILLGMATIKCANQKCGRTLIVALDQSGDGQMLSGRTKLLSLIGNGLEPEDGGVGELVWDGRDEVWLKARRNGEGQTTYLAYDKQTMKWVIPVKMSEKAPAVTP